MPGTCLRLTDSGLASPPYSEGPGLRAGARPGRDPDLRHSSVSEPQDPFSKTRRCCPQP